jgi:hypothetical protein
VTNQIGNNGPILAVVEYRDSLNYYNSGVLNNTGDFDGDLIMEVIGWKDQGHCQETLCHRPEYIIDG